ncbi:MAG: T9SS type A sorting domain-containing protein [Flavobacterium sp.]|nr:T9SS type A sorting domain-containing protein [Flavobacterium sp.]
MKTKITYLFLILPLFMFAQGPFNFDTSTEGFTCNSSGGTSGAHTVTQSAGDLRVDFVTGQGNNPIIKKVDAGINADTNINFIEIRLKNLSGITYLRLAPAGTTANYGNVLISTNDTQYQTYTVDVTAWTGAAVGIDILCKKNTAPTGGGNAYTPSTGEYILIDYIKPLASLVTPEVNVFNFDSTTEGFTNLTRSTAVQETESLRATLKINCTTAASTNAKVALSSLFAHVEGTNKYAHITLKNTSTNTLFQLNGKATGVATAFIPIQTYTPSDTDYKTYDFDLSTWDSGYQFPELNFSVKNTWLATATYVIGEIVISGNTYCKNTSGANSVSPAVPHTDTANWAICDVTGATTPAVGAIVGGALDLTNFVYVDSIVFDNVVPSTLGTDDFGYANNTISLYPNPAQEVLNVSSAHSITKIEVYDLLGKKVASNKNAKNVNVATLGKGAYIVKVLQENGSLVAKQFIKE